MKKKLWILLSAFLVNISKADVDWRAYDITDIKKSNTKRDIPPCDRNIHRLVTIKEPAEYFEPGSYRGNPRTGLYTYYYDSPCYHSRERGQRPLGSFQRYTELTAREIHPRSRRKYILETFGC